MDCSGGGSRNECHFLGIQSTVENKLKKIKKDSLVIRILKEAIFLCKHIELRND